MQYFAGYKPLIIIIPIWKSSGTLNKATKYGAMLQLVAIAGLPQQKRAPNDPSMET